VLVSSDADGGSYQLYIVPKDGRADSGAVRSLHKGILTSHCSQRTGLTGSHEETYVPV
jgi:hypothetical protein